MSVTASNSNDSSAFDPEVTHDMRVAFEEICAAMKIPSNAIMRRNAIAARLIAVVRSGERDPNALRDIVLRGSFSSLV